MTYTLITGACGGLGGAFVDECVSYGDNLILVGRSYEKLCVLRDKIVKKRTDIQVLIYEVDLSSAASREVFFDALTAEQVTIKRLINVAGVDTQKAFEKYSQDKIILQTRVNFEGAVCLSKYALEHADKGLEIVNVSSISGASPMPFFALYSASKCALTNFSVGLREEVKKKGIKVTAVTPGGIPTRDDIKEQIKGQGLWGKLSAKSPEYVAKKALKGVRKNKAIVVPGFFNKVMNVIIKILPRALLVKIIAWRWSKIEKDAF